MNQPTGPVKLVDEAIVLRYQGESETNQPYVAIDNPSGGYPYPVTTPFRAKRWPTEEAALKYAAMFAGPDQIQQKVFRVKTVVM